METVLGGARSAARGATPDVLPASQYLQERLQERRTRNMRPKKARQSDFGPSRRPDDDIFLQEAEHSRHAANRAFDSSPLTATERRVSGMDSSSGKRRGIGVKDMDEQMDRLTKQNFALKLELDNRRELTAKLHEQMEDMREQVAVAEQLQQEHSELLRINTQLVDELEKRDKAVEEAMDIICELEDTVTDLQERNSVTRPSTANADSGYAGTDTHEQVPPSSPPDPARYPKTPRVAQRQPPVAASAAANKLLGAIGAETPARPKREPHVLSQKKPSTQALRSVYLGNAQALKSVQSFNSLLTKRESKLEEEEVVLDSPRLSVLSESSFPSIYSPKGQLSPDRFAWEGNAEETSIPQSGPTAHLRQDSIKRVSQWMEERDEPEGTPSKSNRVSPPIMHFSDVESSISTRRQPVDTSQYQSLAKTLSNGTSASAGSDGEIHNGVSYIKPFPIRTAAHLAKSQSRPSTLAGPMFGEPLLPPTPDSASTRMLRASRSSVADEERSLLDTTPLPIKGYDALEPAVRTAPKQFRSSMEMRSAFESYESRNQLQSDDVYDSIEDDDPSVRSELFRSVDMDYDGFPDGSSIHEGTPSRFRNALPRSPLLMTSAANSAMKRGTPPVPRRRQSSSGATPSQRKPSMTRAETSPTIFTMLGTSVAAERLSSSGSIAGPPSHYSGSSGNKTITPTLEQQRAFSPDLARSRPTLAKSITSPPRSRASPSPARTLGQKTQALFRRMSTSQRDNTATAQSLEQQQQREKSPLPTLTSTPSSAYVNEMPRQARRPSTARSGDIDRAQSYNSPYPRPGSSRDGRRPSLPLRTNTAPTSPPQVEPMEGQGGKNLFRRTGSVRTAVAADTGHGSHPTTPLAMGHAGEVTTTTVTSGLQDNGAVRGISNRRRGSFREAVGVAAGRRPWR